MCELCRHSPDPLDRFPNNRQEPRPVDSHSLDADGHVSPRDYATRGDASPESGVPAEFTPGVLAMIMHASGEADRVGYDVGRGNGPL